MSKVFALLVEYHFEDDQVPEAFEDAVRALAGRLQEMPAPPANVTAFAGDEAHRLAWHAFGREIERAVKRL